jgi:lipopolysaccharide export system protein LptA
MTQGKNEARCDQATFERTQDMLICLGNAELRDDQGCVAGERIEFDLAAETVKVKGGARVVIGGDGAGASGACR